MKLSCVIPAYKDPYVIPTIKSLLDNSKLGSEMEIICVLDAFKPEFDLIEDPRIIYIHLGKNRGMRGAINAGVKVARGKYVLRSDQHCMFAPGYDKQLTDDLDKYCRKGDWIMTCTRYFLDPEKWERMDIEPVNYEKLVIQGGKKFSGVRWRERDKEYSHKQIGQTMAMQGSMWIMPRKWFMDVIYPLNTERYGQMYQDSHEMTFKTWKAGGKMVLNKNTWFAHKHRSFLKGRHEGTKANPSIRDQSGKNCLDDWREYYEKEIKPMFKI